MKNWDLNAGAAKIESGLKTLRTTIAAVNQQWTDQAQRKFQEEHLAAVEPKVRSMLDAITRLADVLAAAEHQCRSE